jgi:ornithine carbamoyltransferase
MKGKDFISLNDFSSDDVLKILDTAKQIKANPKEYRKVFEGKTLAMIFEKPSLRTRVTFETGMTQMGGHAIYLSPSDIQLGKRESIPDVARNLERWIDLVMARTFSHEAIIELAKYANIPIINALSDLLHPCQAMADYMTIREVYGSFDNRKITYVGDGNNVAHSLLEGACKVGMHIAIVTPKGFEPKKDVVEKAAREAKNHGTTVTVTDDPKIGLKDSDVVYTDVWASMGQEAETEKRKKIFKDYQVNKRLMSLAKKEAIFMHCLPAHRGDEVTDEVCDSDQSVIFQQAENRLHAQKAIMYLIAG